MPARITGELLSVGGGDFCGAGDIKFQRLVFRYQVFGEIAGVNILSGISAPDDDRLILRWIDQRNRYICVIKGGHAHSGPQSYAADYIGVCVYNEVIDALGIADGHPLLAAVVICGRDILDNPVNRD